MPEKGHAVEHFKVNGHYYEYSDFEVSAGFNNTSTHGGPEGRYMKDCMCEFGTYTERSPDWKLQNESAYSYSAQF